MFCQECGKEVPQGSSFCPYCAAKLNEIEEQQVSYEPTNAQNSNYLNNKNSKKKNSKLPFIIVIILLIAIIIAMASVLLLLLDKKQDDSENESRNDVIQETTEEWTTIEVTTEAIILEETTTEEVTTQEVTEKNTVATSKDFESIIQTIRDNYYGIQNDLGSLSKSGEDGLYERWTDSNGILRKIVLSPNEDEFRTMTNEFYYDENGMFQFAFLYDGNGNEYRYYFYEGMLYRYIDAAGNTTDYKNGEDPYNIEDIATVYSNGEREKTF